MGHAGREAPKIARVGDPIREIGLDADEGELSIALERLLEQHGVKVRLLGTRGVRELRGDKEYSYEEVQTRYVVRVRSTDLDKCMPEGSRQMDFYIQVTDYVERSRLFLMNGDHGCKDSILKRFEEWLSAVNAEGRGAPRPSRAADARS